VYHSHKSKNYEIEIIMKANSHFKFSFCTVFITFMCFTASAQNADDFVGNWLTPAKDGIVRLERCSIGKGLPITALCGTVVWDAGVDDPKRTIPLDCNRKVAEYAKFESGVWTRGWVFDTRINKVYNSKLRIKDGNLHARAFLANEMYGETEVWTRVTTVPSGCGGKTFEHTPIKGYGN
jgi:uncharacterized protein (DUF2147 family)